MSKRKVPTQLGAGVLVLLEIVGVVILYLSSLIVQIILQAIILLISMVIIWYTSHPLAHYIVAKLCKVRTLFFYIGRSELRNSGLSIAKKMAPLLVTVGTKLDQTKMQLISKNKRAWIYGSGAMVGIVLLALIESYALLDLRFNLISLVVGGLLFMATLLTELGLSTKSGDLSKMKNEISKTK